MVKGSRKVARKLATLQPKMLEVSSRLVVNEPSDTIDSLSASVFKKTLSLAQRLEAILIYVQGGTKNEATSSTATTLKDRMKLSETALIASEDNLAELESSLGMKSL